MKGQVCHATVLNLHQPAGNLEELLEHKNWEAREILFALDRIPRALDGYRDVARVHLAMSGTLLETLSDPVFQARVYGDVKCGELLWRLRDSSINMLGTGYYHPVMPLIPKPDREEHIQRWFGIARHLFDRQNFGGFWPPEMGFSMELVPLLKRLGFRYALVDSEHVEPVTPMGWHELRYRPHLATFGGEELIVIVRDRDLSNAQEAGMEPEWFLQECQERTKHCDFPALITTCTDGENGGWFRNTDWDANFWGTFFLPMMEQARSQASCYESTFIDEYLDRHGAYGQVTVHSGAWNTGEHSGHGFTQWTGSQAQRDALQRIDEVSRAVHDLRWHEGERGWPDHVVGHLIEQAMWRLLRAETSCYLYWGEAWLDRCHVDLDASLNHLDQARQRLNGAE